MTRGTAALLKNLSDLAALDDELGCESASNYVTAAKSRREGGQITPEKMSGFREVVDELMKNPDFIADAHEEAFALAPSFNHSPEKVPS